MKNKADIKLDYTTNEVFVLDEKGKEVFRKPKTEQHISIAHDIYLCHKYGHREAKPCETTAPF